MSSAIQHPAAAATAQLPLPDSGERVPELSWPTVGIFITAIATFSASTWAALASLLPVAVTIPLSAAAIFVLFTVLHDASHYSISRHRWVNVALGRVSMFFVSPLISFTAFAFIHIEHHRNTNDGDSDPDHFVIGAPSWQLPFRFPFMDVPYLGFLARNLKRRPRSELVETAALMTVSVATIVVATATGQLWQLAVVYLIPERMAVFVLAWWFDWLPHHGLDDTHKGNRYRATRNRVGSEWILTPMLLSQNYHLVHHLHPSIPFYRYVAAWRHDETAYLDRNPALITVFGQQLDAEEYREWKRLNGRLGRFLPVHAPRSRDRIGTHSVPVRSVEPLTPDSVKVSFAVPERLREEFAFEPGQHLTVHHRVGGQHIRRHYSIYTSAVAGELAIAVRRVPRGVFSTFATKQLRPGDRLELSPPSGTFGAPVDPLAERNYVAVASGSGITPIASVICTTLDVETRSRFTLVYGNRTADSTMFLRDLEEWERRYDGRLRVVHVRSGEPDHPAALSGRIDLALVRRVLADDPTPVDRWFLCGPLSSSATLRSELVEQGVEERRVHLELFRGSDAPARLEGFGSATVTVTLRRADHEIDLHAGETVLDAVLRNGIDAPYACLGGACGTCTASVTAGKVRMDQNFALDSAEIRAGRVLTCQSRPTTASVSVDYDR